MDSRISIFIPAALALNLSCSSNSEFVTAEFVTVVGTSRNEVPKERKRRIAACQLAEFSVELEISTY